MPLWLWIVIALVVLALLVLAGWWLWRRRQRSEGLRERFGPEYDRAVATAGKRTEAEKELEAREERRETLEIRPLSPEARNRPAKEWERIHVAFVDEPGRSVVQADKLVTEVMRERGYPMDEFEQRAADISVDHAGVVEDYRAAHAGYLKEMEGTASTEELRAAFLRYRSLFDELLSGDGKPAREQRAGAVAMSGPEGDIAGSDQAAEGENKERPVVREDVRVRRIDR